MKVGAVILAAGPSTRMGRPKLLLNYKGVSLLRRAVDAAVAAGCAPALREPPAFNSTTNCVVRES